MTLPICSHMHRSLPVLLLLLASVAHAGLPLDGQRAALAQAHGQVRQLLDAQASLRAELNRVSAEAAALKDGRQGALRADPALEAALRQSQELSDRLATLAQALAAAQRTEAERAQALADTLGAALADRRAAWARAASLPAREALVTEMKALREERERALSLVPVEAVPQLSTRPEGEDPARLFEQADALRDAEDKARAQLKAVEARLTDAREQRALERRMGAFEANEDLMDEQAHDLRVSKSGGSVAVSAGAGTSASSASSTAGSPPAYGVAGGGAAGAPAPSSAAPAPPPSTHPATQAEDVRLPVGSAGPSPQAPLPDDVEGLEARARSLRALAERLEREARAAEVRAHTLQ